MIELTTKSSITVRHARTYLEYFLQKGQEHLKLGSPHANHDGSREDAHISFQRGLVHRQLPRITSALCPCFMTTELLRSASARRWKNLEASGCATRVWLHSLACLGSLSMLGLVGFGRFQGRTLKRRRRRRTSRCWSRLRPRTLAHT